MEAEYNFNPLHSFLTDSPFMTQGEQMQADLGLKNFGDNVFIQKVINSALPIYIITYNSRYPKVHLSALRVKKIKSTWMGKIKRNGVHVHLKNIKLTPPLILNSSLTHMVTGSIVVMRDIAGEFMRQPKVFECVQQDNNNKLKLVESK